MPKRGGGGRPEDDKAGDEHRYNEQGTEEAC